MYVLMLVVSAYAQSPFTPFLKNFEVISEKCSPELDSGPVTNVRRVRVERVKQGISKGTWIHLEGDSHDSRNLLVTHHRVSTPRVEIEYPSLANNSTYSVAYQLTWGKLPDREVLESVSEFLGDHTSLERYVLSVGKETNAYSLKIQRESSQWTSRDYVCTYQMRPE